jgi:protocatechuate 3,4-dioxygenase beta subunit
MEPYRVTFLALDPRLEPVPGATVTVYEAQLDRSDAGREVVRNGPAKSDEVARGYRGRAPGHPPIWTGTTDGLGRCEIVLDAEFYYVGVEHDLVGSSADEGVSRRLDREVVEVVLEPCTRVTGVVRDGDGRGAPGARVDAWPIGGAPDSTPSRLDTRTDGDGRYELRLVSGSTFALRASFEGRVSDVAQVEATGVGGPRQRDLQLPGAFRVVGVVHAPDGSPPVRGEVRVTPAPPESGRRRMAPVDTRGGEVGRFEVLLTRPGEYFVAAHAPGLAHSAFERVVLDADRPVADVTLRLQHHGQLAGQALEPDGSPRAGLDLRVNRQRPGEIGWELREPALLARTAADGTFRVEGVQPSSKYTFTFAPNPEQPEMLQRVRDVQGGCDDVVLRLDAALLSPARVTGEVLDGATGDPLPRFEVTVREVRDYGFVSGAPSAFVTEDGRFEIASLVRAARYDLQVSVEGRQTMTCPQWTAEADHHVQVVFPEPGTVECRVWDRNGAPVTGTAVRFVPEGGGFDSVAARTDEQGAVEVSLAPATYAVHVAVPAGVRPPPSDLEVRPGTRQRMDVHLK